MVAPHIAPTLRRLRAIRDQFRLDHERFHEAPLHAIALFLEEDGQAGRAQFADTRPVAAYLYTPAIAVRLAEPVPHPHGWTTPHDGPFFVYIPGQPEESPATVAALDRQLRAFCSHSDELHTLTDSLTGPARRLLPPAPRNWWASLFHLAVNHLRSLPVSRQRWVNVTGTQPGGSRPLNQPSNYPYRFRFDELKLQVGLAQVQCEDMVPGVMWVKLEQSVYTATVAAIELLIDALEAPPPAAPDWPNIRQRFAELHARFTALADVGGHPTGHPVCRVLKVASSYRPPPASYWGEFQFDRILDTALPLSLRHAEVEYLIHRLPLELLDLCTEAGAALPPIPDAPVLFPTLGSEPTPALALDPVARWMRFVFNTDGVADKRTFHTPGRPTEVYGYAALPDGLFAASVRAIEQAGLLPVRPSSPSPPPNEKSLANPSEKKTKGKDINGRMLKLMQEKYEEVVEWDSNQWARALGCDPSMVRATKTWKEDLKRARLAARRGRARRPPKAGPTG